MPTIGHLQGRIREHLDGFPIVDTHEHWAAAGEKAEPVDLFTLIAEGYVAADYAAAGFAGLPTEKPRGRRCWEAIRPYLPRVRNTSYFRSGMRVLRDLFGIAASELNDGNWQDVNARVVEQSSQRGWREGLIGERLRLEAAIWDPHWEIGELGQGLPAPERGVLLPVVRTDPFVNASRHEGWDAIRQGLKVEVHSLEDLLSALDLHFRRAAEGGAVGMKCAQAYRRTLRFEERSERETRAAFSACLRGDCSAGEQRVVEDYMMHRSCEKCVEYRLPYQIHTGIQSGNGNLIANADPTHLSNLFLKYRECVFDVFHGGYPYGHVLGILGKYFTNVYLDACWLTMISPAATQRYLHEWLDTVPVSKIFAYGGDCRHPEQSYGSLLMAKDEVAQVLAERVEAGDYTLGEALEFAEMMFRENAMEVFRIAEKQALRAKVAAPPKPAAPARPPAPVKPKAKPAPAKARKPKVAAKAKAAKKPKPARKPKAARKPKPARRPRATPRRKPARKPKRTAKRRR